MVGGNCNSYLLQVTKLKCIATESYKQLWLAVLLQIGWALFCIVLNSYIIDWPQDAHNSY